MFRLALISSGALFLGSAGAFLLFVPPVSIATVVLMLLGLLLMFGLGFQTGAQGMASFISAPSVLPQVQSIENEPGSDRETAA